MLSRWERPGEPDTEGVQFEAIKAHLKANDDIQWVWFECAPVAERQPFAPTVSSRGCQAHRSPLPPCPPRSTCSYWCMPQKLVDRDSGKTLKEKTLDEEAEMGLMLKAINDLYLTARVLILLDGSYSSRFWCAPCLPLRPFSPSPPHPATPSSPHCRPIADSPPTWCGGLGAC